MHSAKGDLKDMLRKAQLKREQELANEAEVHDNQGSDSSDGSDRGVTFNDSNAGSEAKSDVEDEEGEISVVDEEEASVHSSDDEDYDILT